MQLVNKQNDLPVAVLHILKNCLQSFLKFTTVFGTCYKRSHIQCKYLFILQTLGHISADDTLCQSLYHRSFTYTGLTDQYRIVFCLPRQNTDDISNLIIPADHRVKLLISRLFYQILSVFGKRVIGCLGIVRGHSLIASHRRKCL